MQIDYEAARAAMLPEHYRSLEWGRVLLAQLEAMRDPEAVVRELAAMERDDLAAIVGQVIYDKWYWFKPERPPAPPDLKAEADDLAKGLDDALAERLGAA